MGRGSRSMLDEDIISERRAKATKTYTFLLPLLGMNKVYLGSGLINCYLGDVEKPEYDHHLFLLFKFDGSRFGIREEDSRKRWEGFVHMYDPLPPFTMYVFDIPLEYSLEYEMFKQGKYSAFSKNARRLILDFHGQSKDGVLSKVFAREEELYRKLENNLDTSIPRSLDPISKPSMDIEIFDCNEDRDRYILFKGRKNEGERSEV